jgi:hypothetical protein
MGKQMDTGKGTLRAAGIEEGAGRTQIRELLVFIREAILEVFIAALATYLVLLIMDKVKNGFASFFINMDVLLAVVLISGFLAMVAGGIAKGEGAAAIITAYKPLALLGLAVLGVSGTVVIYFGTSATGGALFWSLLLGGLILVILAAVLLLDGKAQRDGLVR